jgi:hypothetical protein
LRKKQREEELMMQQGWEVEEEPVEMQLQI